VSKYEKDQEHAIHTVELTRNIRITYREPVIHSLGIRLMQKWLIQIHVMQKWIIIVLLYTVN